MGKFPMLALVAVAAVVAAVVGVTHSQTAGRAAHAGAVDVTVESDAVGRPIPAGFVGLSFEYPSLETYAGTDPAAPNPVFVQLARNLAPGQRPVLRIGGDTTDSTAVLSSGQRPPLGIRYTVDSRWLAVIGSLARRLDARMVFGINLEENSPSLAAAEARALVGAVGPSRVEALEIGNEPELYHAFAWYALGGRRYYGRPAGYDFHDFVPEFSRIADKLPRVALGGPNTGSPLWFPDLGSFLAAEPRVRLATLHRYPLKKCSASAHVTIGQLLARRSAQGFAASVTRYVPTAHAHGVPVRIDEMSAVSCGGARGVSNTFATALWSVDALFRLARGGIDGVNIHTRPGTSGELFTIHRAGGRWRATIHPQYYGLLMFAQAAPPGARLLRISGSAGRQVQTWATRAPGGRVRVVLINKSERGDRVVRLRVRGVSGTAVLRRLLAPRASASSGVTLGGEPIGPFTGRPTGRPATVSLTPTAGQYDVTVPAASAAMLTLGAAPSR